MRHLAAIAGIGLGAVACAGALELPSIFGDGMVLQREQAIPVWGWASPGETITVRLGQESVTATADSSGSWMATLSAREAGGPYRLEIVTGDERVLIRDILVGDVWLCSGQSNMEMVVGSSANPDAEKAAATDSQIRHFKVSRGWASQPSDRLPGGSWEVTSPETVKEFTAVGYFFARELRKEVDVPIGLINSSWGGTRIEPWMHHFDDGVERPSAEEVAEQDRQRRQELVDKIEAIIGEPIPDEDIGMRNGEAVWASLSLDDSNWATIKAPAAWEEQGFPGVDGTVWYRKTIELNVGEVTKAVSLGLGRINNRDTTFVNGHRVGGAGGDGFEWDVDRVYELPSSLLKSGKNVIAVRVEDTGGNGGILGAAESLYLKTIEREIPLAGEWRFKPSSVTVQAPSSVNRLPMALYNKMIHPLTRFPIKGVLWYQGEANANIPEAYDYRDRFAELISGWRTQWGLGDFPFLYVQLANWDTGRDPAAESGWAALRQSQSETLILPSVGQAVTIDIGEARDIHPKNKQDVGRRLALAARAVVYGDADVVYSGPVYDGSEIRGDRVYLRFKHVGSGLAVGGDVLSGFEICGADGVFHPADAVIEGDQVVVRSGEVSSPVRVRYAWSDNPESANLMNKEGLPASPFRTGGRR